MVVVIKINLKEILKMKKYKYIFTDLDGTLYEMYPGPFTELYKNNMKKYFSNLGYDESNVDILIEAFWGIRNCDGKKILEDIFYDCLATSNIDRNTWKKLLLDFYSSEYYKNCSIGTKQNKNMQEIVKILKEKNYKIFLLTNPVFYKKALIERVRWAGIDPDIFEYITSFEELHYTKPYTEYFNEVVQKFNLDPTQILMLGNDTYDDVNCEKLGIDCYIITDSLINRSGEPIKTKYHSTSEELLKIVKEKF